MVDPSVLEPVDPQNWVNMDDMTRDDYVPVPNTNWSQDSEGTQREFNGAIVLLDFTDQPFVVTQEPESHAFENPTAGFDPIDREDVPEYYLDLLNTPSELNGGRTLNEYWMEQTGGRISVQMEAFGPYEMPGKIHEYGLNDSFNRPNQAFCPQGDSCNKVIRTDANALWAADTGVADPLTQFDQVFYITAGHDESSTWEEFGQMMFAAPEDVPDAFGPPRDENGVALDQNGQPMANWAKTRYVPWTSWKAAINHWPNANFPTSTRAGNSTQGESSGMGTFAHEFAHILEISDNYGNPYGTDAADGGPLRDTSGPFDILARGSFNGPGGTHTRWNIPSVQGGSVPAGIALRNRLNLDVIGEDNVMQLSTADLAAKGSVTANVLSRAVMLDDRLTGINLELSGGDQSTGSCTRREKWDCDGGGFNHYTLEVIDRMGTDSFQPDHGVMIAKTKVADRNPFIWTIDANPQDIDTLDYIRGDGVPIPVTRGDQRQLNDALFHAGVDSGSEYEYVDEANGLHFYIEEMRRDADGLLEYDVAIRSIGNAGPQARGVGLAAPAVVGAKGAVESGQIAQCTVPLTNTGAAVADEAANSDIYRISTSVAGDGWAAHTPSAIVTAAAGETIEVPVYALKEGEGASGAKVTITATSENDPAATSSVDCIIDTTRPEVTLTAPATAGPFSAIALTVDATDDTGVAKIVANIYQGGTLVKSTQSAANGATAASHSATVTLPDGTYTIKYNAHDLVGNVSQTKTFDVVVDATKPTVTVKTGANETIGSDGSYSLVSFKLYDAGKIDKVTLNGVVKDLTNNAWSDVNFVKPGTFGAVSGTNELIVYDVAGNTTVVPFTLQ
ncbi:Ig-like domain-containing protein [Agromyces sp. LHK192]|uniref:Ig-like domain-containing protein n=1 Tax=Agromyces sp. LHK192 TaxID=2498704 RepID=UPI001F0C823C|nr:Ig-like domain-containing protein [Agromyces sp. LHK192]